MRCRTYWSLISAIALGLSGCSDDLQSDPGSTTFTSGDTATSSGTEGASGDEDGDEDGTTMADASGGDGDDTSAGDGDGDGSLDEGDSTGDGDDSTSAGDGDDTTSAGDGDDTTSTGDGDGDGSSAGDGDGESNSDDGGSDTGDGDGDTSSDEGGDGDGDGSLDEGGCFDQELSFEPNPPSIVLVLDKSGSMTATYDHDNDGGTPNLSRWEAVHIAVTDILSVYDTQVEFGVKVFPTDESCGVDPLVDVECAPMNAAAVLASIPAANFSVNGSTPTGEALSETLNYLTPLVTPGNKAIIVMADGGLNCGTPSDTLGTTTLISNAYNGGNDPSIPTYVVGINASSSGLVSELNALAEAGGVPIPPGDPGCEWADSSVAIGAGTHTVTFNYSKDGSVSTGLDSVWLDDLSLMVGGMETFSDGLESADFSGGNYTNGGNLPWVIESVEPAATGNFSARSGNIGNSQDSSLSIELTLASAGTLSFSYRTDTEANWDELTVAVDGAQQLLFDGSTSLNCNAAFYDAQNTAEFYAALDGIIGNLVTCDLVLDPPPPIPENIDVEIDGMLIPQLDPNDPSFDCDTQPGWYYSSPDVVTLCGSVCLDFKAMSLPTADVTYYCTPS